MVTTSICVPLSSSLITASQLRPELGVDFALQVLEIGLRLRGHPLDLGPLGRHLGGEFCPLLCAASPDRAVAGVPTSAACLAADFAGPLLLQCVTRPRAALPVADSVEMRCTLTNATRASGGIATPWASVRRGRKRQGDGT